MPWREWSVVDERMKLVVAHASGLLTVTELAARFGISRKTAYNGSSWCASKGRRA